jgi:hypothetical protein
MAPFVPDVLRLGLHFCLWAIVCREVFRIYGAWQSLRCDDEDFDW